MAIKVYNTLTGKKEEIRPLNKDWVGLYTCGPTVYDEAHIGNLRSYIVADVLRRALKYNGYKVRWIMNITDVDDKTIKRTVDEFGPKSTPADLRKYTDRYIAQFKKDLTAVNVPIDADTITFIRVSDVIDEIKTFIKKLIELGYAYKTGDGVYFNIQKYQEKFKDYGDLVGKDFLKGKKVGARVKVDEYTKDDLSDFALWKTRDESDGNIFWSDLELGDGRPGWHIECSVINNIAFNGSPTDIHTGGVDLIFPHHTNEIAQSQPFYQPFTRHWFHSEHLLVDGKKMAKREKNFYTLKDLGEMLPNNEGAALRYLVLQSHYRSGVNFTRESLEAAHTRLLHLETTHNRLLHTDPTYSKKSEEKSKGSYIEKMLSVLNDDLNTPKALATISETNDIKKSMEMLGLEVNLKHLTIPPKIAKLSEDREETRRNQQFIQSDALRKEIEGLGYEIEDTPAGPFIWPK